MNITTSHSASTIRRAADIISAEYAGYVVDQTDIRAALRRVSTPSEPPTIAGPAGQYWWADNCLDIVLANEPDLREMEGAESAAITLRALADRLDRIETDR